MSRDDLGAEMLICDEKLKELALTSPGKQEEHLRECKKQPLIKATLQQLRQFLRVTQYEARKK